jgi:2-dehydropantoate 2-reductase
MMRIAVIGAGGVGGYFGARLAQAGHAVTFVARGRHLAAIRERGLVIESPRGNATVPALTATDDPAAGGPCDVVMFCVKLWDVERAGAAIAPLVAKGGVVIPFQNGVDSAAILQRVLGAQHVLGGVAYIAATIREPGLIAHTGAMARPC